MPTPTNKVLAISKLPHSKPCEHPWIYYLWIAEKGAPLIVPEKGAISKFTFKAIVEEAKKAQEQTLSLEKEHISIVIASKEDRMESYKRTIESCRQCLRKIKNDGEQFSFDFD